MWLKIAIMDAEIYDEKGHLIGVKKSMIINIIISSHKYNKK